MGKSPAKCIALLINKEASITTYEKSIKSETETIKALTSNGEGSRKIQCHYCKRFRHKKSQLFFNSQSKAYKPRKSYDKNVTEMKDVNQPKALISKDLMNKQCS